MIIGNWPPPTLRGTYNTFLGQNCRLLVTNPSDESLDVTKSMKRYDRASSLSGLSKQIASHGLLDYDLCAQDDDNVYGIVTVQSARANGKRQLDGVIAQFC